MTRAPFAAIHADGHGAADPAAAPAPTRVAPLKRWLRELPLAHPAGAASRLLECIDTLNTCRLRPGRRNALLHRLEATVHRISGQLREPRSGGAAATARHTEAVERAAALHESMARGYRLVHASGGKRLRERASRRIVHHGGVILEDYHACHTAPPPGLWQLLHRHGLAPGIRRTGTRYRQLLLVEGCDPWGMARADIRELYRQTARWAGRVRLRATRPDGGGLAVAPDNDAAPFPLAQATGTAAGTVFVDTSGVAARLQREIAACTRRRPWRRRPVSERRRRVLEHAHEQLAAVAARRYPRRAASGRVEVVTGLTAAHRMLAGAAETPQHARFQGRVPRAQAPSTDIWDLIFPAEANRDSPGRSAEPDPPDQGRAAASVVSWEVADRSPDGYRLREQQADSAPGVGEPVLVREVLEDQRLPWELGVVRWVRHHHKGCVDAGVQLIAPEPTAVQLRAEDDEGRLTGVFRALHTAAMSRLNVPATLIVPPLAAQQRRRIWLETPDGLVPIRPEACMERRPDFARWSFRYDTQ
ncbi:hypothetical protein QWY84_08490 [Aquisalimonas lutea]|uniref:hypothetical protein n=1 Tax=Aquisalimonas lutea TaxID=1327750 RepID=UPI0025B41E96|nr:hypothetical protein [Aquisalimonas lutea]MDN3517644.1 hypothetical protein [Aquisalimonas lutea]